MSDWIALPPLNLEARVNQYTERSPGLHLSHITGDMLSTMDPEKYGGPPDYNNFFAGLLFERVLELAWLDKERDFRPELIRPGEVMLDGVTGTPDAYDTLLGRPEEYKCTKKSCRQPITDPKFWIYKVQLMAYAKMTGTTSGALYILHINGNCNRSGKLEDGSDDPESGYIIKGWERHFTQLELDENWAMLIGHAIRRGWL